jgi:hypothetical protein
VPDSHLWDAISRLLTSRIITPQEADDFRAHRNAQRSFLEDAWRRLDDRFAAEDAQQMAAGSTVDPAAPDPRYRALKSSPRAS